MKTKGIFLLLLTCLTLQTSGQTIIRYEMEVGTLRQVEIEEFSQRFTKEVEDSLMSLYPVSIEFLQLRFTECSDTSFTLIYEAKLYETDQMNADYRISRVGSITVASNLYRAQKRSLRSAHKKSDEAKAKALKRYGKKSVWITITGDRKTFCHSKKGISIVEKFIIVKRLTRT